MAQITIDEDDLVTAPPVLDATGKDIASELAKQTALIGVIAGKTSEEAFTHDWEEVSDLVKEGLAPTVFPIGTKFSVPWTDVRTTSTTAWDLIHVVTHHGTVTLKDGEQVPGMYLQSLYALPFGTAFDAAEPDNADANVQKYGSNCYATSNVRQWLNSASTVAKFGWTAQTDTDVLASTYDSLAGYMSGFGSDFLDVVARTKQCTQRNNVDQGGTTDELYDKFFLPSAEQHYLGQYLGATAGVEGEYWEYWKQVAGTSSPMSGWTTHPEMIQYDLSNHSSACYVWMRSARRSHSYDAGRVYSDGYCAYTYAYGGYRVAPACVIC